MIVDATVKCPSCGEMIRVLQVGTSKEVHVRCEHCDTPFMMSLRKKEKIADFAEEFKL